MSSFILSDSRGTEKVVMNGSITCLRDILLIANFFLYNSNVDKTCILTLSGSHFIWYKHLMKGNLFVFLLAFNIFSCAHKLPDQVK